MSSFDTFTEDANADNFSGYDGYTGFPTGGDDYSGTPNFSADGDVPIDHVTPSPEIFGFEDPNSGYSESNHDALHVGKGHGNGSVFASDGVFSTDGQMLPPPSEMEPEEGYALREWRRENAIVLEEKEKREKELRIQILEEAEAFIQEFYEKRKLNVETNKTSNRDREKMFVANQEKFHKEADKQYWKAIADLIPNEVAIMEKKRGKKEQDKKQHPSIRVVQGPKPGKPTDLSRLRHILVKLKHSPPPHMIPPPASPTKDDAEKVGGGKDSNAPLAKDAAQLPVKDAGGAKEEALTAVGDPPVERPEATADAAAV